MNMDRSQARCSFCGKRPPEVQRMVAGPGAAYICELCLQLCNDILNDPSPFSAKALELAARPPVVVAAPQETRQQDTLESPTRFPLRTINIELEQKQFDMTLMLQQLQLFQKHFELHYIWIRPPLQEGFAFVPRMIFLIQDNTGFQWSGDRGGMLLARPELASDPYKAVYQGSAHFSPLISADTSVLTIRSVDPLGQFENPPLQPWQFEVTL
jgi:ClpX C4-type zinc finger